MPAHINLLELLRVLRAQIESHLQGDVLGQHRQQQTLLLRRLLLDLHLHGQALLGLGEAARVLERRLRVGEQRQHEHGDQIDQRREHMKLVQLGLIVFDGREVGGVVGELKDGDHGDDEPLRHWQRDQHHAGVHRDPGERGPVIIH